MKLDSSMVKAYIYIYIYMYVYIYIYISKPPQIQWKCSNSNPRSSRQSPTSRGLDSVPLISTGIWPSPPHEPLQHGFNVLQAGAHHISEYSEYRIRKYEPIQLNPKKEKGLQIKEFQIHSPHQDRWYRW